MRLGVSPAAAPTPTGVSIRGLRLYFPELEPWVAWPALLPAVCPAHLCMNVGPRGATRRSACPALCHSESGPLGPSVRECGAAGSASGRTACPVHPTLRQSRPATATRVLSTPVPVSAPPTGLDECLFFISLVSDLPAARSSASSGHARRHSVVYTYAAILILSNDFFTSQIFIIFENNLKLYLWNSSYGHY